MQATVGDHKGVLMDVLVLKRPDYINWLLKGDSYGQLLLMKEEANRLVNLFDAKPFVMPCSSNACPHPASRVTVYGDDLSTWCWCANCDPHKLGAAQGKIRILQTYRQALMHVSSKCRAKANYLKIIGNLARSKGLGLRVGNSQAEAFFSEVSVPA